MLFRSIAGIFPAERHGDDVRLITAPPAVAGRAATTAAPGRADSTNTPATTGRADSTNTPAATTSGTPVTPDAAAVPTHGSSGITNSTTPSGTGRAATTASPVTPDDAGPATVHAPGEAWLRFLRSQEQKPEGHPNLSLADFVAESDDWAGVFVVSAKPAEELPADIMGDDYQMIMLRILADRFAEAAAEWLHREVRMKQWGYAGDESLTMEEMFRVKYRGIRPAPGYPACPDHTGKRVIFDILQAPERIGVSLTESCMMMPASSVCGYIFASEESAYFSVGTIGRDQLEDYALRCGITTEEAATWLAPNL